MKRKRKKQYPTAKGGVKCPLKGYNSYNIKTKPVDIPNCPGQTKGRSTRHDFWIQLLLKLKGVNDAINISMN